MYFLRFKALAFVTALEKLAAAAATLISANVSIAVSDPRHTERLSYHWTLTVSMV